MEERTDKSFTTSAESSASPSLSQRASNIEKEATKKAGNRKALVIGVIMVIVVLILFIGAIVFLTADHARTANIRDRAASAMCVATGLAQSLETTTATASF